MKRLVIVAILLAILLLFGIRLSRKTHKLNDPKRKIEFLNSSLSEMKSDSVDYYFSNDFDWYRNKVIQINLFYIEEKNLFFPNYRLINHAADLLILYGNNLNLLTTKVKELKKPKIMEV